MASKDNEDYLRFLHLLVEGGTTLLRAVLYREIKKKRPDNKDFILQMNPYYLECLKEDEFVKHSAYYLARGGGSDVELWNLDLLCRAVIRHLPEHTHFDEMDLNIYMLQRARTYVLGGPSSAPYIRKGALIQPFLDEILLSISQGLDVTYQDYIRRKIAQILNGPLDVETSFTFLRKYFLIDQKFQRIQHLLESNYKQKTTRFILATMFDTNATTSDKLLERSRDLKNINEEAVREEIDVVHSIKTEILSGSKGIEALLQVQSKRIEALLQEQSKSKETLDLFKHIEALLHEQKKSKVAEKDSDEEMANMC